MLPNNGCAPDAIQVPLPGQLPTLNTGCIPQRIQSTLDIRELCHNFNLQMLNPLHRSLAFAICCKLSQ